MAAEKKKSIPKKTFTASSLNKLGKTSVIRPTGVLSLDIATGLGGWRSGTFVEIFGVESSGKSLLALLAVIETQRLYGKKSLVIDGEFCWDPQDEKKMSCQVEWFKKLGGNPDLLDIYYPESSEKTYEDIVEHYLPSNEYAYIVIDSWKSMTPSISLTKAIGDRSMGAYGAAALINSEFIHQALPKLFRSHTVMLAINHETIDPNVKFGNPTTTGGGRALKFYSKQRIQMGMPRSRTAESAIIHGVFRKNKIAPPLTLFSFPINFKTGIDRAYMLYTLGMECNVINGGAGGVYYYKDIKFTGGKDNLINTIKTDPVFYAQLESDIKLFYQPQIENSISAD